MRKIQVQVTVFVDDEQLVSVAASPKNDAPTDVLADAPSQVLKVVNGIQGELFSLSRANGIYRANEEIWFHFRVRNITDADVRYAGLGVVINDHKSQVSWGDEVLKARAVLEWDDHISYDKPGTYKIYLALCWAANRGECDRAIDGNGWAWLSEPVELTITE